MANSAISVVIPVYNQEKYVGKCIRSVLSQSFKDFEVILVNDGSTDKSMEVCQKYAKMDYRISIIDKPNGGSAFARRDGMLQAKGQYICFIDSDDYLDPFALERLYSIMCQQQVDVVVGNFDKVLDDWGLLRKKNEISLLADRKIGKDELLAFLIGSGGQLATLPWGRLYKLDCFKKAMESHGDILFPSGKIPGEDRCMNLALAPFVRSLWITNDILYHYRFGGMTSKYLSLIKKGGRYFDDNVDICRKYHLDHLLPDVFEYYKGDLYFDIRLQIRYRVCSEIELRDFIENELRTRKIMLWAQEYLPDDMKQKEEVKALLEKDVEKIIGIVKQEEKGLRMHFFMTRIFKLYQKIEGVVR